MMIELNDSHAVKRSVSLADRISGETLGRVHDSMIGIFGYGPQKRSDARYTPQKAVNELEETNRVYGGLSVVNTLYHYCAQCGALLRTTSHNGTPADGEGPAHVMDMAQAVFVEPCPNCKTPDYFDSHFGGDPPEG